MNSVPAGSLVVLAGPGVVHDGCVDGLRALADAGDLGVANTWGAKGVFPWDSPHHLGTCGLQARDFELLGFRGYDAILATGIDPDESPRERFGLAPVVEIAPTELAALATSVASRPGTRPPNELYARLSAVAQPGYLDERVPLHPARAVADLRSVLPAGGLLAADPGIAGLWVARTFPTTDPGSVVVPARRAPGAAAAIALDAARDGRAAIAVTTAPVDDETTAHLEQARAEELPIVLEVWGAGRLADVGAHRTRLETALTADAAATLPVPVDLDLTALLVDAAGPVVAWGGLGV